MSDTRQADSDEGNAGFASEWQRLARDEAEGQGSGSPDAAEERHETALAGKPAGQAGEAPQVEAAPLEPAPREDADDIWSGVPEAARNAYLAEKAARERAEQVAKTNGGRASQAQREAAELRARIGAQPTEQAPQQQETTSEVPEALRKVAEEYDEVAGPLVTELVQLRQTVSRLERSNATAEERLQAQQQLELKEYLAAEEQKLGEVHSDWREVVVQPDFVSWVQGGPQFVRDGIARNGNGIVDGEEAIAILNLYKGAKGGGAPDPLAVRRQRQLEGNRAVPARSPGITPQGGPNDFSSEWKRLAVEEERRQRQRQ